MNLADERFSFEKIQTFEAGQWIFTEGEEHRDLYIIQSGEAEIVKNTSAGEIRLAIFKKGDFFGDMALLQGGKRMAGARAKSAVRVLILQPGGFLLKIRRDPTFAFEMLQQLSQRVKIANERMLELIQRGKISQEVAQEIMNEMTGRL